VKGGLAVVSRLGFHNHNPQQLSIGLAFHKQAADEVGGNLLGGAVEKEWWRWWVVVVAMGEAW
jgi:hypothetical protein